MGRFLAGQGVFLALLAWWRLDASARAWWAPCEAATAALAAFLLELLGWEMFRDGRWLAEEVSGFALVVDYRCTGVPLILWLLVGLWGLRPRAFRWRGSLVAGLAILALNQLRLLSLFWIGIDRPGLFDAAHLVVWEVVMLATVPLAWGFLAIRTGGPQSEESRAEAVASAPCDPMPRAPALRALSMRSSRLSILRRWARVFSS